MNEFQPLLDLLSGKFGWLPSVITWIGALRLPMKIISGSLQQFLTRFVDAVAASPETDDDERLAKILGSIWYRFIAFTLDALISLKLPTSQSLTLHRVGQVSPNALPQTVRSALGLLLAILLPVCLVIGCATTPQSLEAKSYAITRLVAKKVLDKHPDYREGFTIARDDLKTLEAAETITIVQLMEIVNRLPVDELKDGDTALYVETGILFFADDLGAIAVKNPEQVRFAVRGMGRALTEVLAQ